MKVILCWNSWKILQWKKISILRSRDSPCNMLFVRKQKSCMITVDMQEK